MPDLVSLRYFFGIDVTSTPVGYYPMDASIDTTSTENGHVSATSYKTNLVWANRDKVDNFVSSRF